jgi:hypothetical protein
MGHESLSSRGYPGGRASVTVDDAKHTPVAEFYTLVNEKNKRKIESNQRRSSVTIAAKRQGTIARK